MQLSPSFFSDALAEPVNALEMRVHAALTRHFPDRFVLASNQGLFDVVSFAKENPCILVTLADPMPLVRADWSPECGVVDEPMQVRRSIRWEGCDMDLFELRWTGLDNCAQEARWLVAPDRETGERFFEAVCAWNHELRGEVLVFSSGYWHKSESLYRSIQSATFDNLVLPPSLIDTLKDDLAQFFAARDLYARFRIPWKRGLLLVGPPGNGKTHTIKALINWLGQPCLYVRSFRSRYGTDHDAIRAVFQRARETTPCILVLEDLDSLLTDKNRSYFLNELDGFAANTGIVLIATTNHPERLDPAIVERPSRFDRKIHFGLPETAERVGYVALWNRTLEPEMRLSDPETVAALTDGFSFAYLKELFVASTMAWVNAPVAGTMDAVVARQCHLLRQQMVTLPGAVAAPAEEPDTDDEDDDEDSEG